jgi:cytochrome c oxidase cbb3-type subunit 4
MDFGNLWGVYTFVLIVLFIGIWAWAWSDRRKRDFNAAAELPFVEDRPADHAAARGKEI